MSVYFYVPNLIGYARVILALAGFAVASRDYVMFLWMYSASFLLDAADGYAARLLGQSSKLGAVLDMVTDRCGTAGLCMILAQTYPVYTSTFVSLVFLDIFSHWFRMYSSLSQGSESHKVVLDKTGKQVKQFFLLHLYYNNRIVLGGVCLLNEFFYVFLFWWNHSSIAFFPMLLCAPVFLLKQFLNVVQLVNSCNTVVRLQNDDVVAPKRS
eukprot:ANDGO_08354.mRNA.1 CDP-diacylglycerol--inositol 3-phosphatidyltransferase